MNRNGLTVLILAAFVASVHAAPAMDLGAVEQAVLAAKPAQDAGLTQAIATLRESSDRSARLPALRSILDSYSGYAAFDQERALDVVLSAMRDADPAVRDTAIRGAGTLAENADVTDATRIAFELGQLMEQANMPVPVPGDDYRGELLEAYAGTGGRVQSSAYPLGTFLALDAQVLREQGDSVGSREKIDAAAALDEYLQRGWDSLYEAEPNAFQQIGQVVLDTAQQHPFALSPRPGYPLGADPDLPFRAHISNVAVLLCGGQRSYPSLVLQDANMSQQLRELAVSMYHQETDPNLKASLGIRLGLRGL